MTTEYNQQLKQLFRSNTIVNIKLGISLALGQGYSWNYIAKKCLEEWLLFRKWESTVRQYYFSPHDCSKRPGICLFDMIFDPSEFQCFTQLMIKEDIWVDKLEEIISSTSLEEIKKPAIDKMEEFLKLIYNNEHSNM